MVCKAEGEPQPNIEWRKNNEVIESNRNNHFLSVVTNDLSNSAEYTCTASNAFGNVTERSQVDILGSRSYVYFFGCLNKKKRVRVLLAEGNYSIFKTFYLIIFSHLKNLYLKQL